MDENMENNVQNQGNQSNNGLAIAGFVVGLVSIFLNFSPEIISCANAFTGS